MTAAAMTAATITDKVMAPLLFYYLTGVCLSDRDCWYQNRLHIVRHRSAWFPPPGHRGNVTPGRFGFALVNLGWAGTRLLGGNNLH